MNELFVVATGELIKWLGEKLPTLGPQWWKDNVFNRLTFQQQRLLEERRITSLSELDLAAALRVLDQNWRELSDMAAPLPRDARNWVKELQSARNRWAHAPSTGLNAADSYRDADTLGRLLASMGSKPETLERIERYKNKTLARRDSENVATPSLPIQIAARIDIAAVSTGVSVLPALAVAPPNKFAIGQLVCLRSSPSTVFPVLTVVTAGGAETRYGVFESGRRQVFYESQLQAIDETETSRVQLSANELSAMLTALHLSSPSMSSLYSLNSGRVKFVPYQYRPVFKLIRSERPRLLIADEVGVGKTIEAGLILKELQARNDIKSVLIICPKALVSERKWEQEMKRFDEHFVPLDGALLRHCLKETHLNGEWPVQYEKVILPTSLFDNDLLFGRAGKGKAAEVGLLNLDPPPRFDLVIVDEAHHIRNPDTFLHQAVRYFADNAEAVVFLSATPVQLGSGDLFTLLNVLRPDLIIDRDSFAQMAEPNCHSNRAIQACRLGLPGWPDEVRKALVSVTSTTWGETVLQNNPGFQHIYDALAEEGVEGRARVKTIQALEDTYTFSSLINRTRRRDIGEFTTRKAETLTTEFTATQQALHDDLLSVIARILSRLHGNQNVKFMMTTVSRQAASSLYGLAPTLKDMLNARLDRLETSESGDDDKAYDYEFLETIRDDIQSLIDRAERLDPNDPKADAFMRVVEDKLAMPKNKILLFSTFRHTLAHLSRRLEIQNIRFGLVHGGVLDEQRAVLRHRFSLPKSDADALDVLLSSEVGCEGLDFQFCDCLVNYDLPWNPMRIEQRIGRIDRYGQESQTVAIVNLITPGTIDAAIYDRCLSRIGVFKEAIGGNEEILGEITREIQNIAETFNLTAEEFGDRLLQLSDNKIRQIEEEKRLEQSQSELFGLDLTAANWEETLARSRNFWLEPAALASAVKTYLMHRLGKDLEYLLGDKPLKTLRLAQEARANLLEDFKKIPRSTDQSHRNWERWLKGTSPNLQITFDQECAVENNSAVLLSLGHPLLRQAAAHLKQVDPVMVRLCADHESLPLGVHKFALYRWVKQGVKRAEELVAVAVNADVCEGLLALLPSGLDAPMLALPDQADFDELDAVHHLRWLNATTEHVQDNRQILGMQIQSLTASHLARQAQAKDQVERATNDKIRVMKQSLLDRLQPEFDRRIKTLQLAAQSGDIHASPVLFGVIEIGRPA